MKRNIAAVVVMLLLLASGGVAAAAAEALPSDEPTTEALDQEAWPSLIREMVETADSRVGGGAGGSPVITPGSASVIEGDGAPDIVLEVPVTLTSASTEPVTVDWATFDRGGTGLATAGVDYDAGSGMVTFLPGSTSEMVAVTVIGDDLEEPDEWLLVAFSNPSPNATLDTSFYGLGAGLIIDDDTKPIITPGSASAVEGTDATVEVPVTLSEPSPTEVTVDWTPFHWPGLAQNGADYEAAAGTVSFAAGETSKTVTVTINDDVVAEPGGEFGLLAFSNPSANAVLDTSFYGLGGFFIEDDGDVGSAGCGGPSGPVTEMRTISTADGLVRDYRLHAPASYDAGQPTPLVLHFHGSCDSIDRILEMTQVEPLSDTEGFVVVSPVGTEYPDGTVAWNTGNAGVDDLGFIEQLLDQLGSDLCVDVGSVFTLGLSNGAAMSSLVGCVLSDRIAAVGSVSFFGPSDCGDSHPSAVVFHGTADTIVPFGATQFRVGNWVAAAGCDPVPDTEPVDEVNDFVVELRSYTGCNDGGAVEFYVIEGGGHRWPGDVSPLPQWLVDCCVPPACEPTEYPCIGETSLELDATAVAWEFFQDHPLS